MSIKNIFDKFFILEDDMEESEQTAHSNHNNQAVAQKPNQVQQEQQPIMKARTKKERKFHVTSQEDDASMPNNVVSLQSAASLKNSKVILVEPRVYAEAQDIAEHIKNKRAAIVNLQRIDRDQGVRIIDFLSGTVYALGGDIQRVGNDIFLCTPENVEVTGEISNYVFE